MFEIRLNDDAALRQLEERHATELFDLVDANRDHLGPWLPWVDGTRTVADTLAFIRKTLAQFAENRGVGAGIWHEDRIAGVIGFHPIDWVNNKASIGYWLAKHQEGKGLATLAVAGLLRLGFDEYHLNRIEIEATITNARSRAIPERLGFVEEGIRRAAGRVGDGYEDLVLYGLLVAEWRTRTNEGGIR